MRAHRFDFPDLPINAFLHIGDRRIKPHGPVSSAVETVSDVVGGAVESAGDVVGGALDTVSDVGSQVDDFVNEEIPGGWATVGIAAGVTAGPDLFGAGAAEAAGAEGGLLGGLAEDVAAQQAAASSMAGGGLPGVTFLDDVYAQQAAAAAMPGAEAALTGYEGLGSGLGGGELYDSIGAGATGAALTGYEGLGGGLGGGELYDQLGAGAAGAAAGAAGAAGAGAAGGALGSAGGGLLSGALSGIARGLVNPQTIQGLLTGAGGLIQGQQDVEARRQLAEQLREAAKQASAQAQFRPVGITTRFGTSNFQINPQTGQLEAAGYTVSPEMKALQDRLMGLAGTGLTQAEQAQAEFAPLGGAAKGLFGLGEKYLARSPQEVAQQYVERQQALLQPEQERQLATIQNRLQRTGRGGLAVAQGGQLQPTSPELAAYYNALAQQNLQLAAQGEQAGQQATQFGAGLFGTGANLLGQRYAGQQAALTPFSQYLAGVSGIESQAQQPLTLSANLGQLASNAGYRAGALGLQGNLGAAQAMYPANAYSPTSQVLGGLGQSPLAAGLIGQGVNSLLGAGIGMLGSGAQAALSNTALGSSGFGTGLAYGNEDYSVYI